MTEIILLESVIVGGGRGLEGMGKVKLHLLRGNSANTHGSISLKVTNTEGQMTPNKGGRSPPHIRSRGAKRGRPSPS